MQNGFQWVADAEWLAAAECQSRRYALAGFERAALRPLPLGGGGGGSTWCATPAPYLRVPKDCTIVDTREEHAHIELDKYRWRDALRKFDGNDRNAADAGARNACDVRVRDDADLGNILADA